MATKALYVMTSPFGLVWGPRATNGNVIRCKFINYNPPPETEVSDTYWFVNDSLYTQAEQDAFIAANGLVEDQYTTIFPTQYP